MAFEHEYDFSFLENEAEHLVIAELGRHLEELKQGGKAEGLCTCEDCVLDMAALALNSVKPLYRVSLLGTLYAAGMAEDKAYAKELRTAVTEAVARIRANPSHD